MTGRVKVTRVGGGLGDSVTGKIHVEALGGTLTKLSKDQAEYIGVDVEGPYKPEHYRY